MVYQSSERVLQERRYELLKERKKRRGLKDLWFFDKHILGYNDLTERSDFHGELCEFVEKEENEKVLVLEPRGSLKSSCITIGYTLQQIAGDGDVRILIASQEFLTSKKFLAEIKGHIEHNDEFRSLYGNLEGKVKWSDSEIIVSTRKKWRKEPTITCAGIDVTKVGLHYDIIVIDDPHSDSNVTTREQIEKVKSWYRLVLSLLDPGGKLIVIGTRWHYDDLYGWLIDQERMREQEGRKARFQILKKRAYRKGGVRQLLDGKVREEDLLFPSRLTLEHLTDTALDQGPYIFSCQYLNEPVDDESATFKRSWVQFYNEEDLHDKELRTYSIIDPMRDEDGKDWCAIVTVSMDPEWICYIREVRRGKWDEYDTLDQLARAYNRWKPSKIGFETVAWQKSYCKFVMAEAQRQGLKLPIVPLQTDTRITKRLRIRGMVPYWKSGLFRVPGDSIESLKGNMAIMIDELTRYPKVSNEDTIDALAYADQLMKRPQVAAIVKMAPPGSFKFLKGRYKSTKKKKGVLGSLNVRSM